MNISVITVVRNAEKEIISTMDSVLQQSFREFEYIVVDGASTDKTYEIVCSYDEKFKGRGIAFRHVSEIDSGIYDAMNKAVKLATGKYVNYMNAGDYFSDANVLKEVNAYLESDNSIDVVYGDVIDIYEDKEEFVQARNIEQIVKRIPFCHQACFTKRSLILLNQYNCKYKIAADYDMYLRLYEAGYKFLRINRTICSFRTDGISRQEQYRTYCEAVRVKREHGIIKRNNIKRIIADYYYRNLFIKGMPFHSLAVFIQGRRKK